MTLREQAIASMAVAWSLNADMGDALDGLLSWLRDNTEQHTGRFIMDDGTLTYRSATTVGELVYLLGEQ